MSILRTIVHLVGPVSGDGGQRCSRCGKVLLYLSSNALSLDGKQLRAYKPGSFVGCMERYEDGNSKPIGTVLMNRDAFEVDEEPCRKAVQ